MTDSKYESTPTLRWRVGDRVRLNIPLHCQPTAHTRIFDSPSGMPEGIERGADTFGHLVSYNGRAGRIVSINGGVKGHPIIVSHDDFPGVASSVSECELDFASNDEPPANQ